MKNLLIYFIGLFVFISSACEKDQEESLQKNTYENVVLSSSTYEPGRLENFSGIQVSSDKLVLTFSSSSNLPGYKVGDILIGKEGGGYLRKVKSVSVKENTITVTTEDASLDEAFDEIKIDTSLTFFPSSKSIGQINKSERITIKGEEADFRITSSAGSMEVDPITGEMSFVFPNMALEVETIDKSGKLEIKAEALKIGIKVVLHKCIIDYAEKNYNRISLVYKIDYISEFVNVQMMMKGGLNEQWPDELHEDLMPDLFLGTIPLGPVVLTFDFNLAAGIQGNFLMGGGVNLVASKKTTTTYLVGADYTNGQWHETWEKTAKETDYEIDFSPTASIEGEARLFVKPKIKVKLYKILGPTVFLRGFLYGGVKFPPIDAECGFGVDGGLGFELSILTKKIAAFNLILAEKKWPFWNYTNNLPSTPSIISPLNNSTNQSINATLQWFSSDPDGDPLKYDVYLSTNENPATLVSENQTATSYQYSGLSYNTQYYWKVDVIDSHGNVSEGGVWNFRTTIGGSAPVANFTAEPRTITAGGSVQFTDQSTNIPTSWLWNFGDGNTSNLPSPAHTYAEEGTYTVTLTATNNFGSNVETKSGYIIVNPASTYGIIFNPDLEYGEVTDIEGNVYKTIEIGTQTWMAENLKTTMFNDNTRISNITDPNSWGNMRTPGYCWYDNDAITYEDTYGALYNWYAVNTGRLCPLGWHVPLDPELVTLIEYLNSDFSRAGGLLKETGTTHWVYYPNVTNETGFTALPGGQRAFTGEFLGIGNYGSWWTASESDIDYAIGFSMGLTDWVGRGGVRKVYGHSVRCLKD
ncbi:MAG: PKD domain-containing protein [Prolixibacteraceae bacterium]|nr:PKD domain-containing protein [Prolixibacteraceae bacterium]